MPPYAIGPAPASRPRLAARWAAASAPDRGFIRNSRRRSCQLLLVKKELSKGGKRLKGFVLMGSGEPLDNYEAVVSFLEAVQDPERLGMSLRHVTLSTCGLAPRIRRLAELGRPLNLAVSLNAPNNALRNRLMPINRRYPLEELLAACDEYAKKTGRRVTYEYILIDGVNDRPEHAAQLADLLAAAAHVNLIRFNAVSELGFKPGAPATAHEFARILRERQINATVRRRLGADIDAACGQLRNRFMGDTPKKERQAHEIPGNDDL